MAPEHSPRGTTVVIDPRFCGPRTSGHGGYTSGLLAGFVDGPATVRLLRPPPLGRELLVQRGAGGAARLIDPQAGPDEALVGSAEPRALLRLGVPEPLSPEQAAEASAGFMWADRHPFPSCFACGTGREVGDAWRIAGGPAPDGRTVASPAVCPPDLVAADGTIPQTQVWAALDCITSHPLPLVGAPLRPGWLLGTQAVDVVAPVRADASMVVMGWPLELDGRKFHSAGALFVGGRCVAVGRATWIQLRSGDGGGVDRGDADVVPPGS